MHSENNNNTDFEGWLIDKTGRRYGFKHTEDGSSDWIIYDGETRVGYMWCKRIGDEYHINDFRITDTFVVVQSPIFRTARRLLGIKPIVKSMRRHGLGTALLDEVIRWARRSGIKRVSGMIAKRDVVVFHDLPLWYERHGFTYVETPGNGPYIGTISMQLSD